MSGVKVKAVSDTTGLLEDTKSKDGKLITHNELIESIVGHINNTNAVGDGSNALKNVPLGYDRGNGKGVALLVDASGRLSVDINSGIPIYTHGATIGANPTGLLMKGKSSFDVRLQYCAPSIDSIFATNKGKN